MLESVREKSPLVHFLTNYVTANDCANITLALGASPIMADTIEEVEDMVRIASSLVLNIGTLNARTLDSMLLAGKSANQKGIPVVLDPVGVGASVFRNKAVERILKEIKLSVIKGNASEMRFLCEGVANKKGVDASSEDWDLSVDKLKELSQEYGCVCAMSGEVDCIVSSQGVARIYNGTSQLTSITGSGCMSGAMIGAFVGSGEDGFSSSIAGLALMGIAGEVAEGGNGSFARGIIDVISNAKDYAQRIRVEL